MLSQYLPNDLVNNIVYPYMLPYEQFDKVLEELRATYYYNHCDESDDEKECVKCGYHYHMCVFVNDRVTKILKTCSECRIEDRKRRRKRKFKKDVHDKIKSLEKHILLLSEMYNFDIQVNVSNDEFTYSMDTEKEED